MCSACWSLTFCLLNLWVHSTALSRIFDYSLISVKKKKQVLNFRRLGLRWKNWLTYCTSAACLHLRSQIAYDDTELLKARILSWQPLVSVELHMHQISALWNFFVPIRPWGLNCCYLPQLLGFGERKYWRKKAVDVNTLMGCAIIIIVTDSQFNKAFIISFTKMICNCYVVLLQFESFIAISNSSTLTHSCLELQFVIYLNTFPTSLTLQYSCSNCYNATDCF